MSHPFPMDELKRIALWLREQLGLENVLLLDMLVVLQKMKERFPNFEWKEVDDSELEGGEGLFDGLILRIPARVLRALEQRYPRARFTIAHELGHWALAHEGYRFRRAERRAYERASQNIRRDEREAERFAAFFIAPDHLAEQFRSVEDLMNRFGLSRPAAEIRRVELDAHRRAKTGQLRQLPSNVIDFLAEAERKGHRVKALYKVVSSPPRARARRASAVAPSRRVIYLSDLCTNCGQQKLMPIDNKYRCDNCHYTFDRFQDGDRADG